MTSTYLGILVVTTGLMMAVAPLLQIHKILKHKHAKDISQALFWTVTLGVSSLAIDGWYIHNYFIAISSTISACINGTTAVLVLKYAHKHTPDEE